MPQKLKSRKFWLAAITTIVMLIAAFTGADLDPEEVAAIILPIVAYIAGESWIDGKHER